MRFFFNAEFPDHGLHGNLDSSLVQRLVNEVGIFESSFSTRKDKVGMPVSLPKVSQNL